jgi:hypothetical protein
LRFNPLVTNLTAVGVEAEVKTERITAKRAAEWLMKGSLQLSGRYEV